MTSEDLYLMMAIVAGQIIGWVIPISVYLWFTRRRKAPGESCRVHVPIVRAAP